MGGACSDNRTSVEKNIDDFLRMIKRMPNMKQYAYSKTNTANFTRAWLSRSFGGSVLSPLGGGLKGKKTKYNNLEWDIKHAELKSIYGGGYYVLENVQQFPDNENWFFDIYILIQESTNMEHMKTVRQMHQKYQDSLLKKKVAGKDLLGNKAKKVDYILYDDIKESLTGWARMVSYKSHSDYPSWTSNELDSVVEGEFKNGVKHGYARGISAIDGSCAAGFHTEGSPNGKWVFYKPNGEFAKPEGLYEGNVCTKQIKIHDYKTKILKDM